MNADLERWLGALCGHLLAVKGGSGRLKVVEG